MPRYNRPLALTAHWFTDDQGRTAHALTEPGWAACTERIEIPLFATGYWKSDMPPGIRPCPDCETILAGE